MKIALKTLGCRLNEAEIESWSREFHAAGHTIVQEAEHAALIVLNSCAVTAEAVRKSRRLVRRMRRDNPSAKLVVTGCYVSLEPAEVERSLGADLIVLNADKRRLVELTRRAFNLDAPPTASVDFVGTALFERGRQRAFIKVQDGCRHRCTFCIVTVARGGERSRPIREIVAEINLLQQQGIQEAVLTGVHLGGYGSDLNLGLERLIEAVLRDTDLPRLRLGSLEPWDLPEAFFDLLQNPRFMPHLHLPLQSGCDSVLRRMDRRCKTRDFRAQIARARAALDDINITTDMIVGFPGENEREWAETLSFTEEIGFGHVHIFPYSRRKGTTAAEMSDQVPVAVKKVRAAALHALAAAMKRRTLARFPGREFPVLWESRSEGQDAEEGIHFGYTPNFMRVAAPSPGGRRLDNTIAMARLTSVTDSGTHLEGEVILS